MSWVVEGFDHETERLADRIEVPAGITEEDLSEALGHPEGIRYAVWPATSKLVEIVERAIGRSLDLARNDYFLEYQVQLTRFSDDDTTTTT